MTKRKPESGEENIESEDGKGRRGQASVGAILPSDEMASTRVLPLNDGPLPKLVIVDLDKTVRYTRWTYAIIYLLNNYKGLRWLSHHPRAIN